MKARYQKYLARLRTAESNALDLEKIFLKDKKNDEAEGRLYHQADHP